MAENKILAPPRRIRWAAALSLVLANPLSAWVWLWLWSCVVLSMGCPWPGLQVVLLLLGLAALLPLWASLREGLRLLRVVRLGKGEYLWLRDLLPHPARSGVWLGHFESAQGHSLHVALSHACWQEGHIYLLMHDPVWPEESVAWDDLPLALKGGINGSLTTTSPLSALIPWGFLGVALAGGILVWQVIAR